VEKHEAAQRDPLSCCEGSLPVVDINNLFSGTPDSRITRSLERAHRSESDFALDNIGYQEQRRQHDETSLHGFVLG
jgi:hypothetical protein